MKLIIDIPNYNLDKVQNGSLACGEILKAVKTGTPLPKGHGRLIDAEKLANCVDDLMGGWNRFGNEYESGRYDSYDFALDEIEEAPTVIEADKEVTDD